MDEAWNCEINGSAPSFQEFLAAGEFDRTRFLDEYMRSRGLSADATNREMLASFLNRAANRSSTGLRKPNACSMHSFAFVPSR